MTLYRSRAKALVEEAGTDGCLNVNVSSLEIGYDTVHVLSHLLESNVVSLNLSYCVTSLEMCQFLAPALSLMRNLTWLDLSANQLTPSACFVLGQGMYQLTQLRCLILNDNPSITSQFRNFRSGEAVSIMLDMVPAKELTTLEIARCKLWSLAELGPAVARFKSLGRLNLEGNTLDAESHFYLSKLLTTLPLEQVIVSLHPEYLQHFRSPNPTSMPRLTELKISSSLTRSDIESGVGGEARSKASSWLNLVPILKSSRQSLRSLDLGSSRMHEKDLAGLLDMIRQLKELRILKLGVIMLGPDLLSRISAMLSDVKQLEELELMSVRCPSVETWMSLGLQLSQLHNLRTLNLNNLSTFEGNAAWAALPQLPATITQLKLADNKFDERAQLLLLSRTLAMLTSLTSLDLSGCSIGASGAPMICDAVGRHAISTLVLDRNGLQDKGAEAVAALLPKLSSTLVDFSIMQNDIPNSGCLLLIANLVTCQHLSVLRLSKNSLGSDGLISLSRVLPNFPTLRVLDITDIQSDYDGFEEFCFSLLRYCTLETLLTSVSPVDWLASLIDLKIAPDEPDMRALLRILRQRTHLSLEVLTLLLSPSPL